MSTWAALVPPVPSGLASQTRSARSTWAALCSHYAREFHAPPRSPAVYRWTGESGVLDPPGSQTPTAHLARRRAALSFPIISSPRHTAVHGGQYRDECWITVVDEF